MRSLPYFCTWSMQSQADPLEVKSAQGSLLQTSRGDWLDFVSTAYNVNLGHGDQEMKEAIRAQASSLATAAPNHDYPAKSALAKRLLELAPEGFDRVFFTLGGSEAVENAIKIAHMVTKRGRLLSRYRSYHGASLGALSLTGDYRRPPMHSLSLPGVVHAMESYVGGCPFDHPVEECGERCAQELAKVMDRNGSDQFAAAIMEPIPGANGVLIPAPGYWKAVREVTRERGTLLICDEVLTGFGRTGRWFGLDHEEGVVPDLITISKGLTSGYATLGAVLVHRDLSRYFDEQVLYAGLTGYAHPIACATALKAIELYEKKGLIAKAGREEERFHSLLTAIGEKSGQDYQVRARGLLGALEIKAPKAWHLEKVKALKKNRIGAFCRPSEGTYIFAPCLSISEQEWELAQERLLASFS